MPWAIRPLAPRVTGAVLIALARESEPEAASLRAMRGLMRALLRHHLGGRELNAWRMFAGTTRTG